mmetsp:Transcript_28431/g.93360  ORF Transcript_28431/g.93360 Transcript_28431/m.93360 type:complete len:240 (-) Transcript_28431:332-1051(-)
MFSVDTTSASALCWSGERSSLRARSRAMSEAEHPIPPRLNVCTSERKPKRLTSMAEREGVGQKREQLTTRIETSCGATRVASSSCSTALNIMHSASSLAPRMQSESRSASTASWPTSSRKMEGGKSERSEMEEVRRIFSWNCSDLAVKHSPPSRWRAARLSARKRSYATGSPAVLRGSPPTEACRYVLKSTSSTSGLLLIHSTVSSHTDAASTSAAAETEPRWAKVASLSAAISARAKA